MASHLTSLWKWDFLELGNGLLDTRANLSGEKSKMKLSGVSIFGEYAKKKT